VLVDTSVWVDHLRRRDAALVQLLEQAQVWTHPFVIGELACGNLPQRSQLLGSLSALPHLPVAAQEDVLTLVDRRRLMALPGVGRHAPAGRRGHRKDSLVDG